jgi:hypothetical protein
MRREASSEGIEKIGAPSAMDSRRFLDLFMRYGEIG